MKNNVNNAIEKLYELLNNKSVEVNEDEFAELLLSAPVVNSLKVQALFKNEKKHPQNN